MLITEKGNLAVCRQKGLEAAKGNIVIFIDDDVYCEPSWLESITQVFRRDRWIVGVSGPTEITDAYKRNRDVFKFKWAKVLHDRLFLGPDKRRPGALSSCGTPSLYSNSSESNYTGPCEYLEACNMAIKRDEAIAVGGFDRAYIKTSEWCEVDLALKLSKRGLLWYEQKAKLYHRPSKAGVYKARLSTSHRWTNFMHFQRKWVTPTWRAYLYRTFIWTYLKIKDLRMI